jgi:hypothetical protein
MRPLKNVPFCSIFRRSTLRSTCYGGRAPLRPHRQARDKQAQGFRRRIKLWRDKMARQAASGSNSNPRNTTSIPVCPDGDREGSNFRFPPLKVRDLRLVEGDVYEIITSLNLLVGHRMPILTSNRLHHEFQYQLKQ